jgi:hypothetical protein
MCEPFYADGPGAAAVPEYPVFMTRALLRRSGGAVPLLVLAALTLARAAETLIQPEIT